MARVAKRKPPSRVRYEEAHPTVSCRIPRDLYDRLTEAKQDGGKSFADILKLGLGVARRQARKAAEIRKQGWNEGYKKGYADAAFRYKVSYHCSKCGQIMEVQYPNEKEAIDELMRKAGWTHGGECPRPRQ